MAGTSFAATAKGSAVELGAAAGREVERAMGIEPTLSAWEAEVLPLNYTRFGRDSSIRPRAGNGPLQRNLYACTVDAN